MESQPAEWLSADEVARPLGVSAALIRKLAREGAITSLRVGTSVRIPRTAVEELIERNTRPARTRAGR